MKRLLTILFVLLVTVAGILYFDDGKVYAEESEGTAYAVLTAEGDLIFFRSNESYYNNTAYTVTDITGKEFTGTVYTDVESNKNTNYDKVPWYRNRYSIKRAYVADGNIIKPINMSYWFYYADYLESFDGTGFDTSNTINMKYMFCGCHSLSTIDLTSFNTSNVTDMQSMFYYCYALKTIDLSSFDTSEVTNMSNMFGACTSLSFIDLSNFNLRSVTDMSNMLGSAIHSIRLGEQFINWTSYAYLPANGVWVHGDLEKTAKELYDEYPSHASEWAGEWNLLSANAILTEDGDLIFIKSYWPDEKETTITDINGNEYTGTFYGGVEYYSEPAWDTDIASIKRAYVAEDTVISPYSMSSWFSGAVNLESFDTRGIDTSNVKSMSSMFCNCSSLTSLDLSCFDTSNVTEMSNMFNNCSSLTNLDLSGFDTSNVIYAYSMFHNCSNLTSLNLSGFDTSNVTNMESMFSNCSSLTSLDVSSFSTSNVTNMESMFSNCSSLTSLNISSFDTSNVTSMYSMFNECILFTSLDLSNFDTSNVYSMQAMFKNCSSLTSLGLSNFNTVNLKNMRDMFSGCSSLTSLDISGFNTSKVSDMSGLFDNCDKLYSVTLGPEFTWWFNRSYLPTGGTWVHGDIEKTAQELYNEYPSHASEWSGIWVRVLSNAVLTDDGDLVFFNSHELFTSGTESTVIDINGNQFTGTVYSDVYNPGNYSEYEVMWYEKMDIIKRTYVAEGSVIKPNDMSYWFNGATNLISFDGKGFDTSNVINMNSTFSGCSSMTSLNLSSFDTSNVTNMSSMFSGCNKLSTVELGTGFTNWISNAYLPSNGVWVHDDIEKTAEELYNEYPLHASEWAGEWKKLIANAILTKEGDLIFFKSFDIIENGTETTVTDVNGVVYSGTVYTNVENTSSGISVSPWYSNIALVKRTYVADHTVIKPVRMQYWFSDATNLESFDGSGFDTSNVFDMRYMFSNCSSLKSLDFSSFDTSNVTNINSMFYNCSSLISLDLSNFDTSNVTNMSSMFSGCNKLSSIKLGTGFTNWISNAYLPSNGVWVHGNLEKTAEELYNEYPSHASEWAGEWRRVTANAILTDSGDLVFFQSYGAYDNGTETTVTDIKGKEYTGTIYTGVEYPRDEYSSDLPWKSKMSSIKKVYVAEGSIIKPKNISYWFNDATKLTSFDGKGFDTSNVTDMSNMFFECSSLTSLDLSSFDTSNVTYMNDMFYGCNKLSTIELGPEFTNWINSAYLPSDGVWVHDDIEKTAEELYNEYPSHASEWAGEWRRVTANAILTNSGDLVFFQGYGIYDNGTETTVTDIKGKEYTGTVYTGVENSNTSLSSIPWYSVMTSVKKAYVADGNILKPRSMSYWFCNATNLESFDGKGFDTSNITNMNSMFYGCSILTSLDLSSLDTSNVTNMDEMFRNCSSLTSLELSSFNTSNVSRMKEMFYNCNSLTSLDLSSFDTSKVTDMYYMFSDCHYLTTLDISSFDTSNVSNMYSMFDNCYTLKTVKLGSKFTVWKDDAYLPSGTWKKGTTSKTAEQLYTDYPANASSWAGTWERQIVKITGISQNSWDYTDLLYVGETTDPYFSFTPTNATIQVVKLSSNNEKVVKVTGNLNNYTLTAVGEGTAEITAAAIDGSGVKYKYTIRVLADKPYAVLNSKGELVFVRSENTYDYGVEDTVYATNGKQYTGTVFTDFEKSSRYYGNETTWRVNEETYNKIKKVYVADGFTMYPGTMSSWFSGCENLTSFNTKGFDGSRLKYTSYMFNGCTSLKTLDLSGLDTSKVTSMYNMFSFCSSMTSLKLGNFDTSNVGNMTYMFSNCGALTSLDLSSFSTGKVTDMNGMFDNDSLLKTIYASEGFVVTGLTYQNDMFWGCTSLVGGNGTKFDSSHTGSDYARIDKVGQPGYFTYRSSANIPAPTISSSSMNTNGVTLKWSAVTGADEYVVYRKQGTGSYKEVGRSTTTSYTDKTALAGTKYTYAIKAHNTTTGKYSDYSAEKTLTYNPFKDVKSTSAHYKNIMWAFNKGLVNGTSKTTFSPEGTCMRKSFAIMLWKLNGRPAASGTNPFTDIDGLTSNEKKAIQWCYKNKIVSGMTKTTFAPEGDVTRKAVVIMLWKAAGRPEVVGSDNPFTDISKLSANEKSAILWAYENGITKGTTKTTFGPEENCTREQLCTFLARYNNLLHIMD